MVPFTDLPTGVKININAFKTSNTITVMVSFKIKFKLGIDSK